jgi:hypothetical protein
MKTIPNFEDFINEEYSINERVESSTYTSVKNELNKVLPEGKWARKGKYITNTVGLPDEEQTKKTALNAVRNHYKNFVTYYERDLGSLVMFIHLQ